MDGQQRVVIVTGAGAGIGRATALALARAGWSVGVAGRSSAALQETRDLAPDPDLVLAVPTDVRDEAAVEALFADVVARFGRLDLLFNNAGVNVPGTPFEDLTLEAWRSVIETNLTGAFLCARAAFRQFKAQTPGGGRIVNNGSISAHVPRPRSAAYTASKHAMTGLTRTLALDGRPFDIVCGQIDIGNASTPLTEKMAKGVPQANGEIAVEPTMDVEHAANAVVHMASLPLDANIPFLTVMANRMPFMGRG